MDSIWIQKKEMESIRKEQNQMRLIMTEEQTYIFCLMRDDQIERDQKLELRIKILRNKRSYIFARVG